MNVNHSSTNGSSEFITNRNYIYFQMTLFFNRTLYFMHKRNTMDIIKMPKDTENNQEGP